MSNEDPFFAVRDEVRKAVETANGLYQRWCELLEDPSSYSKEEYEWTTGELRNSLRSIEWDLDDLEETIGIVEKNPRKFHIDAVELAERRVFVERTKQRLQEMKDHLASPDNTRRTTSEDKKPKQSLLSSLNGPGNRAQGKYTKLENEIEASNQQFIDDSNSQQKLMMTNQDETLTNISSSAGVLKNMSQQIGTELDEQAVMLDDFATEMDATQGKMNGVVKRVAKVLHMSNDRRQWLAIGLLILILVVVVTLFFVL